LQPTRNLPTGYRRIGRMDILNDTRLLVKMNLWGTVLFFVFAVVFALLLQMLRPADAPRTLSLTLETWGGLLGLTAAVIGTTILMILLHEGTHGLFFWLYTRTRPVFTFRIYYASANAPGWYLPRRQFLVTTLAPFVLISAAGTALMAAAPGVWLPPLLMLLVFNASGSIGDLMVALWLLRQPETCMAYDEGYAVSLFLEQGGPD